MNDTNGQITIREQVLRKAKECVCGQRQQDYGTPEDNFALIASLWSAYLGKEVSAKDVAMLMGLMKIARIKSGSGTFDSFVDLAGYAACGAEVNIIRPETDAERQERLVVESDAERLANSGTRKIYVDDVRNTYADLVKEFGSGDTNVPEEVTACTKSSTEKH